MKILHLADLHLGIENYGRVDPATGLHSRLIDYLDRLDEALTLGLDAGVDLVLIAGDIYKSRSPNPTHQREFARRIRRLCAEGVAVFILVGNHDVSPAAGRAHSVEIFAALDVEGVTIADRPRLYTVPTRAGPLPILAIPWVTHHALLSREELRGAPFSALEYEVRRRLERFIAEQVRAFGPDRPCLIAFHGSLDGAQAGAERSITLGQDLVLSRSVFIHPGVAYVALGHIHKHQVVHHDPPMVYAGSLERVDFGERDEPKGCVLVELVNGKARWQFHPLHARPFVSIEHDLRRSSDPLGLLATLIKRQDLRGAVVRVEVQVSCEQQASLSSETIRRMLDEAGAFMVAGIVLHVERAVRQRFADAERLTLDGLAPRQALEHYLRTKQPPLSPERITALLAAADELIGEERDRC